MIAQDGSSQILDDNNIFKGLRFFDAQPQGLSEGQYALRLLVKAGSDYVVPATSYLRFDSSMVSINNTPLSTILSVQEGSTYLNIDVLSAHKQLTASKIFSNNISGDNGSISKGVADKAVNITDASGNNKTAGSSNTPVYLSNGQLAPVSIISTANGGTGQSDLSSVKVGSASVADVASK